MAGVSVRIVVFTQSMSYLSLQFASNWTCYKRHIRIFTPCELGLNLTIVCDWFVCPVMLQSKLILQGKWRAKKIFSISYGKKFSNVVPGDDVLENKEGIGVQRVISYRLKIRVFKVWSGFPILGARGQNSVVGRPWKRQD